MSPRDAAEQATLLRLSLLLGGPTLVIGLFAIPFICWRFHLPGSVMIAGLVLLLPATVGLVLLVEHGVTRSARNLIHTLHAANIPAPRQGFSRMEALAAQGKFEDAATAYRLHLAGEPEDVAGWLALGRLLAGPLADPEGAAEAYRAARRCPGAAEWERIITNDLIDLYQQTGQRGRLQVELARFTELHRGTTAGEATRERLRALKDQAD